jgi:D-lyxose ketol-isomerase
MKISKGFYTTNNSDLTIQVINIAYSNEEYTKARIKLINTKNGIVYEEKYYKLYHEKISHWIKVVNKRFI